MIISFETEILRDRCASQEKAETAFGSAHAQALINLLSEAEASDTADELIALYSTEVHIDSDSFSLTIGAQYRVVFVAIGVAITRDSNGAPNWSTVRRLKMDISDVRP